MKAAFEESRDAVARLVGVFEDVMRGRKALEFDEASTRASLIDPFWRALGWDVEDPREVVHEKRVATRKGTKRADYCFNVRGRPAFVVEAKEAGKKLTDPDAVFQAVRYGYNLPVPVAILTDFQEFRPFKSALEPVYQNPERGLIKKFDLRYDQYLDRWEEVYKVFSREAVYGNSLEKLVGTAVRNKEALDRKFFERLTAWREELARVIALDNGDVGVHDLNEAVQRILDRIIFVRVIEDREIEPTELLQDAVNRWAREKEKPLYQYVVDVFRRLDPQYNGELFASHFSEGLLVRDKALQAFVESLYYPLCPYQFNVIGVEMLGTIYERFLGSTITLKRWKGTHRAEVEEKPEVRKAGGVYYTPAYIVDYIVENTVGKLLDGCKTPKDVAGLKILDPACGSGSFLLGAFRRLIEWHEDYYNAHPEKISKPPKAECWLDREHPDGARHRLTARAKGRVLVNNIYGVDIDPQAVEVTVMSLYLKVLEDVDAGLLMKTALLPPLDGNVKCGNSLIGSDYWDFIRAEQGELFERTEAEDRRVNPFDWDQEFPEVIKYKPGTRDLADGYGFDAVIGNPPYGMVTELNFKSYYGDKFGTQEGRYDIYELFVEKGIKLCGSSGFLGFIIPSPILSNLYTRKLREFILSNTRIEEIVNFGMDVFSMPTIHSCILILNNRYKESHKVKVKKQINTPTELLDVYDYTIIQKELGDNENSTFDIFVDIEERAVLNKIKAVGIPLNDLCFIRQCIKTGNDREYVRAADEPPGEKWKRTLRGKSIKRYSTIEENLYVKYGPWLARNWKNKSFYETEKIAVREAGDRIIATIDYENRYFLSSLYSIYPKGETDLYSLLYILGILNSRLSTYYMKAIAFNLTKGAFTKFRTNQLGRFPFCCIDFSDPADVERHDLMVRLVDEMLDLHKRLAVAKSDADRTRLERAVKTTDRRIDALVYELYGLSDEEIALIEKDE